MTGDGIVGQWIAVVCMVIMPVDILKQAAHMHAECII
jgi:hypothetical protein